MYTGIHLKQEQDFDFSIPARSRTRFRAIFPVRTELEKRWSRISREFMDQNQEFRKSCSYSGEFRCT